MPVCSRSTSQPLPSSHAAQAAACQSSPGVCAQLARIVAKPPSSTCSGVAPHHLVGDRVSGEPAVAEEERRLRRDHVRRVGDDEVELLASHRLEEAARAELDVLDAVQHGVEGGEVRARARSGRWRRRGRCAARRESPGRLTRCRCRARASTGRRTVRCESVNDGPWTPATWSGCSESESSRRSEAIRMCSCGTTRTVRGRALRRP